MTCIQHAGCHFCNIHVIKCSCYMYLAYMYHLCYIKHVVPVTCMLHTSYSELGYLLDPLGLSSLVADISWNHCYSLFKLFVVVFATSHLISPHSPLLCWLEVSAHLLNSLKSIFIHYLFVHWVHNLMPTLLFTESFYCISW